MIRCVVFDFDGTLVDSNEIKRRTFFDVVAAFDPAGDVVAHVLDEIRPGDRFAVSREVARLLHGAGSLPATRTPAEWAREFAAEYGRRCEEAVSKCPEIPGASAALAWLAGRDVPSYVNSATPEDSLRRTVERRSMASHFRLVLGGPASKRENLARVCGHAGCASDGALMVGDGEDDRIAALEFGCPFVAVVRPGPNRFSVSPALRIRDLDEFSAVAARLVEAAP